MTRPTREFTTPLGNAVVLNEYLTGREAQELKEIMLRGMKMNVADAKNGQIAMDQTSSTFLVDQEKAAMKYLVVSVNGNAAEPVTLLLDLPSSEYVAVVEELQKIQNPTTPQN
jgi:hypothetical protein